MKSLVTHPDNAAWLRAQLDKQDQAEQARGFGCIGLMPSWGIEIRENPLMDRDKPSGKYKLPDGRILAKAEFVLRERFIEYGPEDIPSLVWLGVIVELREPLFYEVDSMFRSRFDFGPMIHMPRSLLINGAW